MVKWKMGEGKGGVGLYSSAAFNKISNNNSHKEFNNAVTVKSTLDMSTGPGPPLG